MGQWDSGTMGNETMTQRENETVDNRTIGRYDNRTMRQWDNEVISNSGGSHAQTLSRILDEVPPSVYLRQTFKKMRQ